VIDVSFPFDYGKEQDSVNKKTLGKYDNMPHLGEEGVITQDYRHPSGYFISAGTKVYESTVSGARRMILPDEIAVVPEGETNFIGVPRDIVEFRKSI
jgi:hypothetical protein